jgi:hypothetical protein
VLFSAAYHLALDKRGKTYLTLGGQGGYVQRRFDKMSFDTMFEDELSSWAEWWASATAPTAAKSAKTPGTPISTQV